MSFDLYDIYVIWLVWITERRKENKLFTSSLINSVKDFNNFNLSEKTYSGST